MVKEFRNQRKLNHKNIIKVFELYIDYTTKKMYMVIELAEGQEMFEAIKDLGHYSGELRFLIHRIHEYRICCFWDF